MATPQLDVYMPDGSIQSFPLTEEKVIVGTSSRCQVQLDRPELSAEHLLLSPRPEGCWVAIARGVTTQTLVNGSPFERGMVPWGKEVLIGSVRMVLNQGLSAKKEEKSNPLVLILAAVVVPVCIFMSFGDSAGPAPQRVRQAAPALFDELNRPCPQNDPQLVLAAAQESARIALSKSERMPFRTRDGIDAVNYYAQSSACFRNAGDESHARTAMSLANSLKARLEDDYRAHQFRMERALEQERWEDALYETRMVTALVSHRQGPYLQALGVLERQLTMRLDQAAAAAR
ncbi:MAG: FHA domain-containing protein [Deltaproteobacteria bacterium]|nr:FHA domain-containing protein [Deltaproteobacteria bacterium]